MRAEHGAKPRRVDVEGFAHPQERKGVMWVLGEDPRAHVVEGTWRATRGSLTEHKPQCVVEHRSNQLQLGLLALVDEEELTPHVDMGRATRMPPRRSERHRGSHARTPPVALTVVNMPLTIRGRRR